MEIHRRTLLPLVFFLFFLVSCRSSKPASNAQKNGLLLTPELTMEKMRVRSFHENGLQWEMLAKVGEGFTNKKWLTAREMDVTLYQGGQKSTQLWADKAFMNSTVPEKGKEDAPIVIDGYPSPPLKAGDMFLTGNVVAISTDGNKITTDWAHYHRSTELITSTAPVRVVRPDSVTDGVGMEATSNLSDIKIFNQTLVINDAALQEKKKKP